MSINRLVFLCAINAFFFSAHLYADQGNKSQREERLQKAKEASEAILNLSFYRDGRGIIVPTSFLNLEKADLYSTAERFFKGTGLMVEKDHIVGAFNRKYKDTNLLAVGCVACHSGKVAGQLVVGLGNKNIDVHVLGKILSQSSRLLNVFGKITGSEGIDEILEVAGPFYKKLASETISNQTQGLVPTTLIRTWFYESQNKKMPENITRGEVKVPHLFGYAQKREVGLFADGKGDGHPPGWGLAVELVAGQKPEVIRELMPAMEAAETIIGDLLPPEYPFEINHQLVAEGKDLFSDNCARCHGEHEVGEDGLPVYEEPEVVAWERVKTDYQRLADIDTFYSAIDTSSLADLMGYHDIHPSYVAPRLHAIWARFPYLHHAAIPNLKQLLTHEDERVEAFSLTDAGDAYRFDKLKVGLTVPEKGTRAYNKLMSQGKSGKRSVYYTKRKGHGKQGHNFGVYLEESEKMALIEYLKTL